MYDKTIITGVIGVDGHVVGLWLLNYALREAGFKVVSLGAAVSQVEFIQAAIEAKGDAILVSSIYGLAAIDCDGLREKCQEAGLQDVLLYVGGNLTTSEEKWEVLEKRFKDMGFSRVYPPDTLPATALEDLKMDLNLV